MFKLTKSFVLSFILCYFLLSNITHALLLGDTQSGSSATTASTQSCPSVTKNLQYAVSNDINSGGEVSILQAFLKRNGYLDSSVLTSGNFGNKTLEAVKLFQTSKIANVVESNIDSSIITDAQDRKDLVSSGFVLAGTGYVGMYTRTKIKYTNIGCVLNNSVNSTTLNTTDQLYPTANQGQPQPTSTPPASTNQTQNNSQVSGNTSTSTISASSTQTKNSSLTPTQTSNVVSPKPSISFNGGITGAKQGSTASISWSTTNAPSDSAVAVLLVNSQTGSVVGTITRSKELNSTFSWKVPDPKNFVACADCVGLKSVPAAGSYKLVVRLYSPANAWFGDTFVPVASRVEPTYLSAATSSIFSIIPAVVKVTEWTSPGTYTYTVPSGVTSVKVNAIAGGGGGYKFGANPGGAMFYSGAGGGATLNKVINVTDGEKLTIVVGVGGIAATAPMSVKSDNGGKGGNTQIKRGSTNLINLGGGNGGGPAQPAGGTGDLNGKPGIYHSCPTDEWVAAGGGWISSRPYSGAGVGGSFSLYGGGGYSACDWAAANGSGGYVSVLPVYSTVSMPTQTTTQTTSQTTNTQTPTSNTGNSNQSTTNAQTSSNNNTQTNTQVATVQTPPTPVCNSEQTLVNGVCTAITVAYTCPNGTVIQVGGTLSPESKASKCPVTPSNEVVGRYNVTGNGFKSTALSRADAITTCKSKFSTYMNSFTNGTDSGSVKCTWNGEEVYSGSLSITLSATPLSVVSGKTTTVTWSTKDLKSCKIVGLIGGTAYTDTTLTGSKVVGPLTTARKVTLSCTTDLDEGMSTTLYKSITISVTQPAVAPTQAKVNGVCGSDNNTTSVVAPTVNLCSSGAASAVSDNGSSWTWTCSGSGGGSTANCLTNHFNFSASLDKKSGLVQRYVTGKVLGASTACLDLPRNIQRGAESSSVTNLQKFLQSRGLLNEVTGFYGDKTVEAVKEYQASKNLPITGAVYETTRDFILADSCE